MIQPGPEVTDHGKLNSGTDGKGAPFQFIFVSLNFKVAALETKNMNICWNFEPKQNGNGLQEPGYLCVESIQLAKNSQL